MPILRCAAVLALAGLTPVRAEAQQTGSRAIRESATRVMIEASAVAAEDCTRIKAIRPGAPAAKAQDDAGSGAFPVTARLQRGQGICRSGAKAVRGVQVLELPAGTRQVRLFVEGPDGALVGTELVPVR